MRSDVSKRIQLNNENIDLGNMNISDEDIPDIMNHLARCSLSCKELFLDSNCIKDPGAVMLASYLSSFKQLRFLDLQSNQISEDGLKSLMTLQHKCPNLTIGLNGNLIHLVPEAGEEPKYRR